ncbi:MAG: glutathione S-transferase family protein [Acidobacteriota bacterium]|nr:glutathione S-transferase family protein [Acidobacteriota bacterium]
MTVVLYEHPLSAYAQKVKIALLEKSVPFELRLPSGIGSGAAPDAGFASGNPRLEVPLLIVEDAEEELQIFDSTIMLEYLEDRFPDPSLLPTAPADRARARMLEDVIDTHYEAITWGLAEIRHFGRAQGELAAALEARAAAQLGSLHGWLGERLGDRLWFNGDAFGWADLAVVPFVNGAVGFGHAPEPGSGFASWLERANARDSVSEVRQAAAQAAAGLAGVADLVEQGRFKRQYRDHRLEWMVRSGGVQVVLDGLEKSNIRFTGRWD